MRLRLRLRPRLRPRPRVRLASWSCRQLPQLLTTLPSSFHVTVLAQNCERHTGKRKKSACSGSLTTWLGGRGRGRGSG